MSVVKRDSFSRQGQYLHPGLRDEDGVLELRRPTAVAGNDSPIVGPLVAIGTALRYHRLDREDHTGQELHGFVVAEMLCTRIISYNRDRREPERERERKKV